MRNNHAFFHRIDARAWWCALALGCFSLSAFGGYALPAPPAGFGGSPGSWTFTPPANAPTIGGGAPAANGPMWRGPGPTLPSAGGGVPTSAAFRMGAGGGRALAGAIARGLIPGLGLALGLAWLAQNCVEKQNGQWVRTCGPGLPSYPQSTGIEYKTQGWNSTDEWFLTYQQACDAATAYLNAVSTSGNTYTQHTCTRQRYSMNLQTPSGTVYQDYQGVPMLERADTCPAGWYKTPAGCMASPPPLQVTPEQIEEYMAPKPLPDVLPGGVPYPLDPQVPFIFNPTPGDNPQGQPMRVPQGNPVPIPNTNPQQYRQPVTRWAHSPSPNEPWRMSADPQDVIGTDPQGMTEPQPETGTTPSGSPPEKSDLCADHPDILACQKVELDTPEGEIPKDTKEVTFQEESMFGGGSCPADRVMTIQRTGQTVKAWDWAQACSLMLPIRAIVMTLATFAAFLIVMPGIGGKST